jgi:hypothetical protein
MTQILLDLRVRLGALLFRFGWISRATIFRWEVDALGGFRSRRKSRS